MLPGLDFSRLDIACSVLRMEEDDMPRGPAAESLWTAHPTVKHEFCRQIAGRGRNTTSTSEQKKVVSSHLLKTVDRAAPRPENSPVTPGMHRGGAMSQRTRKTDRASEKV